MPPEGYGDREKFFATRVRPSPLYLDGRRFDENGRGEVIKEPTAFSMSRNPSTPLTLVAGLAIDDARKKGDRADWSKLMAQAQEGDREVYRRLLEGMTPYLRLLARRCFKESADVEDARAGRAADRSYGAAYLRPGTAFRPVACGNRQPAHRRSATPRYAPTGARDGAFGRP
jgi:hypothetical protein